MFRLRPDLRGKVGHEHGQRRQLVGLRVGQDGLEQPRHLHIGRSEHVQHFDRVAVRVQPRTRGKQHDRYGRLVAVCFKGGEDLNRWMVEQGWAVAYRHYSMDYVDADARAVRIGGLDPKYAGVSVDGMRMASAQGWLLLGLKPPENGGNN